MARPAGADRATSAKIVSTLRKAPRGLWIREIARQSKLPTSTVHRYLQTYLKGRVKVVAEVGLARVYKVKR